MTDLPSSLPGLSGSEPSSYGLGATGAMREVPNNPSSMAASPGIGFRVGKPANPRPSVMAGRTLAQGSDSPIRTATDGQPGALMSSGHAGPAESATESFSGLLSNNQPNSTGPTAGSPSTNPSATGAERSMETGGLFSSQVAIEYSSTNDARASGPSTAPGADAAASVNGPSASRSAYAAMAELRREKSASPSTRFAMFGLAFLGLVIAPFAVSLLRRGLT